MDAAKGAKVMGLGKALAKVLAAKRRAIAPATGSGKVSFAFSWVVRNHENENLDASEHVELVEGPGGAFLSCKTEVLALAPMLNEQGQLGLIIYVDDRKSPMVLGTVPYS